MLNRFEHIELFRDQIFKKQFQELLVSSMAKSLKLDQFLLFKLEQNLDKIPYLVICASTGVLPSEIVIPVTDDLRKDINQSCIDCFIPDSINPPEKILAFSKFISRLGGRSILVAQMMQQESVWGFLVGYKKDLLDISPGELQLFKLLAYSVSLLVENSHFRLGLNFQTSEAESLETISSALVKSTNLNRTLKLITDKTVQLLHAEDALVLLLEDGGEWFRVHGETGNSVTRLAHTRLTVRNSLNGLVITTGKILISQNAQTDPRADQKRATGLNAKSVIIAPLKIRNQVIGTMAVHNKDGGFFSEHDVNALSSFANQAAIAIDNTQLLKALMKSKKDVEEKAKKLQELLTQTLDIQENERRRIAVDIHDGVVSQMIGALYELEGCLQLTDPNDLGKRLNLLKQLLNKAVDHTRVSIYNLWPATLDYLGLNSALKQLFRQQERLTNLRHRLDVCGEPYQLSPAAQIAAYRIVQEAINNSFKHGSANQIDMLILYSKKKVTIEILDDGHGFDLHKVLHSPLAYHFGLIGMRERARSVGGDLLIKSEPGRGCKITLDIPNVNTFGEGLTHDPNTDFDRR